MNLNLNIDLGFSSKTKIKPEQIKISAPSCYLDPLYNDNLKYYAYKSGRGSTKTFTVLQYSVQKSFDENMRDCSMILGRELSTSIDNGIRDTFLDLIRQLGAKNGLDLYSQFDIKAGSITNKQTNCKIIFMGFRLTGGETEGSQLSKLKGLHRIRMIFIDEAESISEDILNVLFPTVNRSGTLGGESPKIKFIFALNPRLEEDPVISKIKTFKNHIIVHQNIFDIPAEYQDKELLEQAYSEKDEYYFDHVWRGAGYYKFAGNPFAKLKVAELANKNVFNGGYAFLDLSFTGGDYTALTVLQEYKDRVIFFTRAYKRAWNECAGEVAEIIKEYDLNFTYEDNAQGTVPADVFNDLGVQASGRTTTGNKVDRIYAIAYKTQKILTMIESMCDKESVKMIKNYNPETSKNDDCPDSLTNGLAVMGYDYKPIKLKG